MPVLYTYLSIVRYATHKNMTLILHMYRGHKPIYSLGTSPPLHAIPSIQRSWRYTHPLIFRNPILSYPVLCSNNNNFLFFLLPLLPLLAPSICNLILLSSLSLSLPLCFSLSTETSISHAMESQIPKLNIQVPVSSTFRNETRYVGRWS
jgi:hypothetical protein